MSLPVMGSSSSPVFSQRAEFLPVLSTARRERYEANIEYLSRIETAVLASMEPGLHTIDANVAFWIKQAPEHECIVHKQLTKFAVTENFGGIILQYLYLAGNESYDEHKPFALFLEPVEEIKLMSCSSRTKNRVSVQLFQSLLWLHAHDFIHGDIRNNNIFLLSSDSHPVIGDFDRTEHTTTNFKIKRAELLSLYPEGASVFSSTEGGPIVIGMNGPFDLYTDGDIRLKIELRKLEALIRYASSEDEIKKRNNEILYVKHLQEKVREYTNSSTIQFLDYKKLARVMYTTAQVFSRK